MIFYTGDIGQMGSRCSLWNSFDFGRNSCLNNVSYTSWLKSDIGRVYHSPYAQFVPSRGWWTLLMVERSHQESDHYPNDQYLTLGEWYTLSMTDISLFQGASNCTLTKYKHCFGASQLIWDAPNWFKLGWWYPIELDTDLNLGGERIFFVLEFSKKKDKKHYSISHMSQLF